MGENLKDYAYDIRVGKDFFSKVHICVYTNTHTHTLLTTMMGKFE